MNKQALFITLLMLHSATVKGEPTSVPEIILETSDDNDWIPDNDAVTEAREDGQGPTPTPRPKVRNKVKKI